MLPGRADSTLAVSPSLRRATKILLPLSAVMPGLVSGIHDFFDEGSKTWMAGTSPAMTN